MNTYIYIKSRLSRFMAIAFAALAISTAVPSQLRADGEYDDARELIFYAKGISILVAMVGLGVGELTYFSTDEKPARLTMAQEKKRNIARWLYMNVKVAGLLALMAKVSADTPDYKDLPRDQWNREAGWYRAKQTVLIIDLLATLYCAT